MAANIVAGLLLVAGLTDTLLSGLDRPLPSVAVGPPALILAIALLHSAHKQTPDARDLPISA